ncbi:aminotransferase class V-fold PLP-dependent enzyme [Roseomonas sp. HJA6]|uniref:Aminotransferase class V-fold PLP-dependent enzyme n=1 Tax=Roseomonas alba TaxID=2846776 RepID=A0ABS7A5S9_9PROT|nr:aminotransferase class V-fold PLP-dependent enzyme [Neoroseomonas alba]MBW6397661.1 aminotransferase class V-fold PLP-dependent enzyme [Neoroseomonas alba]
MTNIPATGRPRDEILGELAARKAGDRDWRRGRLAVYFYWLDEELERVQQEAYRAYWTENNLGQRAYPSLKSLEDEVIAMALSLLGGGERAGGTFTSGGSESIFLAMMAARNKARAARGISQPNIVLPDTAHLTFDRAAEALGLESRRVPVGPDLRADVAAMAARMDGNTVALVGSAPNYPFGTFDSIGDLAALAASRGIWMHVDACVGGFLAPYVRRLGHPIPDFDLSVPGVTSLSADIHKHGMAPKGASLLLVSDAADREWHRFESRAWQRGPYAAYTTQGTRPGGAVAAAWATMNHLGDEGYLRCASLIMEAKSIMTTGIAAIPGLAILEPSDLGIFVWRATDPALDIGKVAAALDAEGWLVGRQQEPDGVHLHLNPIHREVAEEYVDAVARAVAAARGGATARIAATQATY